MLSSSLVWIRAWVITSNRHNEVKTVPPSAIWAKLGHQHLLLHHQGDISLPLLCCWTAPSTCFLILQRRAHKRTQRSHLYYPVASSPFKKNRKEYGFLETTWPLFQWEKHISDGESMRRAWAGMLTSMNVKEAEDDRAWRGKDCRCGLAL